MKNTQIICIHGLGHQCALCVHLPSECDYGDCHKKATKTVGGRPCCAKHAYLLHDWYPYEEYKEAISEEDDE